MVSWHVQTNENVVVKHHLSKNTHWSQAANWAFNNNNGAKGHTVHSVKMLSPDVVQIVRRKDQNFGLCYKWFGADQEGLYERVTIDRSKKTVAIDRMDGNWSHEEPFIGRRDFFYIENREDEHNKMNGYLTFVRTDFWLCKLYKQPMQMMSHWAAWSYKRSFNKAQATRTH